MKENQDVLGTKYIKNTQGQLLLDSAGVLAIWGKYFISYLNETNEFEVDDF